MKWFNGFGFHVFGRGDAFCHGRDEDQIQRQIVYTGGEEDVRFVIFRRLCNDLQSRDAQRLPSPAPFVPHPYAFSSVLPNVAFQVQ